MRLLTCALVLLNTSTLLAWSNKEHIQLTRIAAQRLIADESTPPEMKSWLKDVCTPLLDPAGEREYFMHQRIGIVPRGCDGLPFWATMPDMSALMDKEYVKVEPFGVHERLLHFIDLEYFMPGDKQRSYAHDLSHKPRLTDFPRDIADERYRRAGMLPFRVQHCYEQLVRAIRQKRLDDAPGQHPRDEHAAKWAGYLAHYLEDNTQPHHATVDYKSQSYFPDPKKAPNVHAEMEYKMCDDELNDFPQLRAEFWPLFEQALKDFDDPIQTDDPWQATLEVSLISYDALPLIGTAARQALKPDGEFATESFFRFRGPCWGGEMSVMEMKARQTAWAVKRVERFWRKAWEESQK